MLVLDLPQIEAAGHSEALVHLAELGQRARHGIRAVFVRSDRLDLDERAVHVVVGCQLPFLALNAVVIQRLYERSSNSAVPAICKLLNTSSN